ncbi:MAG: tryptophan-rich sensory protein [Methanomassiliicoccus sp.]|nr:tryptophan-rich sensory protein [Methanomassiliicoccus sp.]
MVTKKMSLLNWSNIAAWALMVIINGLAGSTTLIGGKVTAEVSDANPTLITPAGYVFAIWGVIYILLAVFILFQALPGERTRPFQEKVGWLFVASSVLNIAWIFAWQYEQLLVTVFLTALLLLTLIAIYLRLDIGRSKVGRSELLAVHVPFSVYLGWVTIATIANISIWLVSIGWDGWGIAAETWALLIIVVATLIASLVAITRRDIAYEAVIAWAFIGISVNQVDHPSVSALLLICVVVVLVVLVVSIYYSRSRLGRLHIRKKHS